MISVDSCGDPSKCNAQAARCTVGDMVNGRIGFRPRHNPVNPLISSNRVENQSKPYSHHLLASSETKELKNLGTHPSGK